MLKSRKVARLRDLRKKTWEKIQFPPIRKIYLMAIEMFQYLAKKNRTPIKHL